MIPNTGWMTIAPIPCFDDGTDVHLINLWISHISYQISTLNYRRLSCLIHDSQDKHDLVLKISFEKAPTDVSPAVFVAAVWLYSLKMDWTWGYTPQMAFVFYYRKFDKPLEFGVAYVRLLKRGTETVAMEKDWQRFWRNVDCTFLSLRLIVFEVQFCIRKTSGSKSFSVRYHPDEFETLARLTLAFSPRAVLSMDWFKA